jgi:type IV pilus assembly protein PilW
MTRNRHHAAAQSGIGLVEFMVALALSLMMTLAITTLFLASSRVYATQGEVSRLQEIERSAVDMLTTALRMSGYSDPLSSLNTDTVDAFVGTNDDGHNRSDSFAVRFGGGSDASGLADGSIYRCIGSALDAETMAEERYYIALDATTGEPGLYCFDGTNRILLVDGVESMQLLYGEDLSGDLSADRYVPMQSVSAATRIVSVVVSLVIRATGPQGITSSVTQFNHFGGAYAPLGVAPAGDAGAVFQTPADGRIRRQVSLTIGLRNRLQ